MLPSLLSNSFLFLLRSIHHANKQLRNLTKLSEPSQAETIAALTARIQLLEDTQRHPSTTSIESSLSALTAIQTDQQAILKDVLIQSNTQHATLSALTSMILSKSPHPHADPSPPLKPLSAESNALHSLIFPGPPIQSDSIKDIIDAFRQLKQIQQKSTNSSDNYIFDYFGLHAPVVFGSLLAKYRIHFSSPHFQFHSPEPTFLTSFIELSIRPLDLLPWPKIYGDIHCVPVLASLCPRTSHTVSPSLA